MSAWHESAIADDPYDPELTLTPTETDLLAIRLAIAHLTYEHPAGEWVDWEDVPWLDEASFEALGASVDAVVPNLLRGLLARGERIHDIDSAAQTSENTVKFQQICASMCDLVRAEFEWSHGSPSDARARMGYILDEVRRSR